MTPDRVAAGEEKGELHDYAVQSSKTQKAARSLPVPSPVGLSFGGKTARSSSPMGDRPCYPCARQSRWTTARF